MVGKARQREMGCPGKKRFPFNKVHRPPGSDPSDEVILRRERPPYLRALRGRTVKAGRTVAGNRDERRLEACRGAFEKMLAGRRAFSERRRLHNLAGRVPS